MLFFSTQQTSRKVGCFVLRLVLQVTREHADGRLNVTMHLRSNVKSTGNQGVPP